MNLHFDDRNLWDQRKATLIPLLKPAGNIWPNLLALKHLYQLGVTIHTWSVSGRVKTSPCPFSFHSVLSCMLGTCTLMDTGPCKIEYSFCPESSKPTRNYALLTVAHPNNDSCPTGLIYYCCYLWHITQGFISLFLVFRQGFISSPGWPQSSCSEILRVYYHAQFPFLSLP